MVGEIDIERRMKEVPVEVEVFGHELGGFLAGIRASEEPRLVGLMAEQAEVHVSFFGTYPLYIESAIRILPPRSRDRIKRAVGKGVANSIRNEALLESFRSKR